MLEAYTELQETDLFNAVKLVPQFAMGLYDGWAIIIFVFSKGPPHTGADTPTQLEFGGF